ncbi:hypothetical protein [Gymnodinialimonas ceratoperidinii]|uniref:Uncharacterized protein n=1 Tax=Gymnodinialimonas ceratoperidinii TaxID=2856823 RepID=A0A8F6TV18_9RHOB|nr:hypothetical protein [Gymnodinialimonas ceratoperidinii]QXT39210.1 hypothetical protein KYE46_14970 [Gymnodinialimonas ceratoperidinii]
MSETIPGSPAWWIETALIAASGGALALLLWDGPIWRAPPSTLSTSQSPEPVAAAADPRPRTLADFVDAGCLTQDHLRALVEGRRISIACPTETTP